MENQFFGKTKEELMKKLEVHFGRKKSTIYDWMNIIGISAVKDTGIWILKTEDFEKLSALNQWVNEGNKAADFPDRVNGGALTKVENGSIQETTIPLETTANFNESQTAIAQLIRSAQEQAAGVVMAKNMLTAQFLADPNQLPEDLLQQVRESERAIAPKSKSPMDYAKMFMNMATAA